MAFIVANALSAEDGATDSALSSPIGEVCLVALLLLLLLLLSSHWEGVQRRMAPGLRTPFVATLRQDGYDHHAGFWTTSRRRQIYADERQNGNDSIEREPSLSVMWPSSLISMQRSARYPLGFSPSLNKHCEQCPGLG